MGGWRKRIAPLHGHSGCQPLTRACIGQGLRADLERLDAEPVSRLLAALRAEGVPEETLAKAVEALTTA